MGKRGLKANLYNKSYYYYKYYIKPIPGYHTVVQKKLGVKKFLSEAGCNEN